MKKILLALLFLLPIHVLSAVEAQAAGGPKGLGLGIVVGGTTGLTGKYFLSDIHAIDTAFGGDEGYVMYMWHGWSAFDKQPQRAKLAAMLGIGVRVEEHGDYYHKGHHHDHGSSAGVRGTLGIAMFLDELPVEFTFELNPIVNVSGHEGSDLEFGLAARYYFTRFN